MKTLPLGSLDSLRNHEALSAEQTQGVRTASAAHTPGPWRMGNSPLRQTLGVWGGPDFNTWICGELKADNETCIDASECVGNARLAAAPTGLEIAAQTYLALLQMPRGAERARLQSILAGLRDYLALATGNDAEEIQNSYERLAEFERRAKSGAQS